MNTYLITYLSVETIQSGMAIQRSIKNIGVSGTSKIIPISKEASELGLSVKDPVVAFLAAPGSPEDYALSLAGTFCSPNVHYVNERCLTSKDAYPGGAPIQDLLNDSTYEEIQFLWHRLDAMHDMISRMREYTKNKVTGPYAYFNDELRTFIVKFDPDDIKDDDITKNIKDLLSQLCLLRDCLDSMLFDMSPLASVKKLQFYFTRSIQDAAALLHCDPEKREELCKELNKAWEEEVSNIVYRDMYFVGLVIPYQEHPDFKEFGQPAFSVVASPTQRMASEKLSSIFINENDLTHETYVFGPYTEEEECRDLVSYLKLKWKLEIAKDADEDTPIWVKNMINEYNLAMR